MLLYSRGLYELASNDEYSLPNRLCHPPLSIRRLARLGRVHDRSRRLHPSYHALAGRTSAANLALPDGRGITFAID